MLYRTVELWMHPGTKTAVDPLLTLERSAVRRSLAVFDALVNDCRSAANATAAIEAVSPPPLAQKDFQAALLGWPTTPEGSEIRGGCQEVVLCLYQVGRLRSVVSVVACAAEWYVVWLSAQLTPEPRHDGFLDDTDAALAQITLNASVGLLIDLKWLEIA